MSGPCGPVQVPCKEQELLPLPTHTHHRRSHRAVSVSHHECTLSYLELSCAVLGYEPALLYEHHEELLEPVCSPRAFVLAFLHVTLLPHHEVTFQNGVPGGPYATCYTVRGLMRCCPCRRPARSSCQIVSGGRTALRLSALRLSASLANEWLHGPATSAATVKLLRRGRGKRTLP